MIDLTERPDGIVLAVKAQPGARRNAVLGERAGALRVAVSAAPEKGKANEAVRDVLSDALGLKNSQVHLQAGETSRDKTFVVTGVPLAAFRLRIEGLLERLAR